MHKERSSRYAAVSIITLQCRSLRSVANESNCKKMKPTELQRECLLLPSFAGGTPGLLMTKIDIIYRPTLRPEIELLPRCFLKPFYLHLRYTRLISRRFVKIRLLNLAIFIFLCGYFCL